MSGKGVDRVRPRALVLAFHGVPKLQALDAGAQSDHPPPSLQLCTAPLRTSRTK